jgi:hypothetical protein
MGFNMGASLRERKLMDEFWVHIRQDEDRSPPHRTALGCTSLDQALDVAADRFLQGEEIAFIARGADVLLNEQQIHDEFLKRGLLHGGQDIGGKKARP